MGAFEYSLISKSKIWSLDCLEIWVWNTLWLACSLLLVSMTETFRDGLSHTVGNRSMKLQVRKFSEFQQKCQFCSANFSTLYTFMTFFSFSPICSQSDRYVFNACALIKDFKQWVLSIIIAMRIIQAEWLNKC